MRKVWPAAGRPSSIYFLPPLSRTAVSAFSPLRLWAVADFARHDFVLPEAPRKRGGKCVRISLYVLFARHVRSGNQRRLASLSAALKGEVGTIRAWAHWLP